MGREGGAVLQVGGCGGEGWWRAVDQCRGPGLGDPRAGGSLPQSRNSLGARSGHNTPSRARISIFTWGAGYPSGLSRGCEYGRLLLLAVAPAGLDPLHPLGGLDDGEGPLGGEVEDQHASGDPL